MSNVVFFALFQKYDFETDLKLQQLRELHDQRAYEAISITQYADVVTVMDEVSGTVILNLTPVRLFDYTRMVAAFETKYLVEDTAKFVTSFSGSITKHFFISLLVALFTLIVLSQTGWRATGIPLDASNKVVISGGVVMLNALYLVRPYWVYRERSRGALNG